MFKYFHIIKFLMTHDLTELKEHWQSEVIKNKNFTWIRLLRKYIKNSIDMNIRYWFWWRLANAMFCGGTKKQNIIALKINQELLSQYNVDIMLGAKIGFNPIISHFSSIIISNYAEIGDNFVVKQNTTIGGKTLSEYYGYRAESFSFKIGNSCVLGAGSCIIADKITIGNNVKIGAMCFINKDLPDNCIVYTKKTNEMIVRDIS